MCAFSNGDADAALEVVDKMVEAGVPLEKNTCQLAVDVAVARGDHARLDLLLGRWCGHERAVYYLYGRSVCACCMCVYIHVGLK